MSNNKDAKKNKQSNQNKSDGNKSKIPVYNLNRQQSSTDCGQKCHTVKNRYSNGKISLDSTMSELPEHIKLLQHIHNRYMHVDNQKTSHRTKMHQTTSLPSTSVCNSGSHTPRDSVHGYSIKSSANLQSNKKKKYEEYLPLCEMQKGLQKGEIVEGILRINPKKFSDAYISAPDGGVDIFIDGLINRNRALNGDTVAIKLDTVDKWTVSYSAICSNWSKWKDEFHALIYSNNKENDFVDIKLENLRLNSQDMNKMNLSKIANKNEIGTETIEEIENSGANFQTEKILKYEYPNLPLNVFSLPTRLLLSLSFWKEFIQRSGKVVYIIAKTHSRICGGHIQLEQTNKVKDKRYAHFIANDSRIPRVIIPFNLIPTDFINNYEQYKYNLFLVKIDNWNASNYFPNGIVLQSNGKCGDVQIETDILLKTYEVDTNEFPQKVFDDYTPYLKKDWKIPEHEYTYRKDFRQECVFTIDPQSARDLDDAISFKKLSENKFEIGVHIADVTYFIKELTLLDQIAKNRATSVYLPDRVIPMLPSLFCQNICSLNPGQDKLTFSVVFVMDENGTVSDKWIGRTVINSCAKLSYEEAQKLINNTSNEFYIEEFSQVLNTWTLDHMSYCLKIINGMTKKIRAHRFETGSLKLNKSRLSFTINNEGLPISMSKYCYQESNSLIEELMLLANKAVGEHLYDHFSEQGRAFLRSHPPPNLFNMNEIKKLFQSFSIECDTSSSLSIYQSLQNLLQNNDQHLFQICTNSLIKSMKMAVYLCVDSSMSQEDYSHYALNFAVYTHFTSPIRRYADVIVHRLLASSLGYKTVCSQSAEDLKKIASNCNTRKYNAFMVSEGCSQIYFKAYISQIGFFVTKALVSSVYDHSFDILLVDFDIYHRIYLDQLHLRAFNFIKTPNSSPELVLKWKSLEDSDDNVQLDQTIKILKQLDVELKVNEQFKLNAMIAHPNGDFIYNTP